jgi:hypothetical protein
MADRPTAADVKALREVSGEGMQGCKALLLKEWRRARLRELRMQAGELYTVEGCHAVILELIEFLQEVENDNG